MPLPRRLRWTMATGAVVVGSLVLLHPGLPRRGASAPADPQSPLPTATSPGRRPHLTVAPVTTVRPPERGVRDWWPGRRAHDGQIEGFTTRVSGLSGEPVGLEVSTSAARFRVVAYRFGDYRGGPAHGVWSSPWVRGRRQPRPLMVDPATRTVVAPWRSSLTVPTSRWKEGFYGLRLVASDGWESVVPYVVRSRSLRGKVALVAPVATWQAYNHWGGYSFYDAPPGEHRAWAVSFDRPYAEDRAGELAYAVVPVAAAAERAHVPLGFLTDVDLDRDPAVLDGARAYVSVGHDEYWTRRMRRAVVTARDAGTNLAFLGANTMYWKVRLSGGRGAKDRLLVGYKLDARLDPARTRAPREATGLFREAPEGPERRVTGMDYECFPVDAPFRVVSPRWWGFAGTGVRAGTEFPHLVGVEADRVYPADDTPRPLQVLANTRYSCAGVATSAQATYYTTPSGAAVLDVGTLRWTCALDGRCGTFHPDRAAVRFTRRVTLNVLAAFARGPAGRTHPARDNLGTFDLSPVNDVPAS
jgi:hypothetical protein